MTFVVDWALKTNYLYLSANLTVIVTVPPVLMSGLTMSICSFLIEVLQTKLRENNATCKPAYSLVGVYGCQVELS